MAYEMPLVCKEIYLPMLPEYVVSWTFDQYKERTGIDIDNLITDVLSGTNYCKIYLVVIDKAIENYLGMFDLRGVLSTNIAITSDGKYHIISFPLADGQSGKAVITDMIIDPQARTIKYGLATSSL